MMTNKIVPILFLLFFIIGCNKSKEEKFVARVGDNFLTDSMVEESLNENGWDNSFREEFIREWIEKHVIYLSAKDNGILENRNYNELVNDAEIKIANSLLISKIVNNSTNSVTKSELEKYYVENISEFKLTSDKFNFNQISFNNKNTAKKFRRKLVAKSWENVLKEYVDNSAVIYSKMNQLVVLF